MNRNLFPLENDDFTIVQNKIYLSKKYLFYVALPSTEAYMSH